MSTETLTKPILYNIVTNDGEPSSVVAFVGDDQWSAAATHRNFTLICQALKSGNTDIETLHDLFDVGDAIGRRFQKVSDRVSINGSKMFLDLEPVDDVITDVVVKYHLEGNDDYKPLVLFMEKVAVNPNEHSKKNLYRWLAKHRFMIAPDGDIIAYKGVNRKGDHFESSNAGTAAVNGELYEAQRIPNIPGAIVEMPRSAVQHNPSIGCHTGLHVGNWRYASGFASHTIRVKVNPRDVVSVPTDSSDEKMRVCRYQVMEQVHSEDTSMFFAVLPSKTRVVTKEMVAEEPVAPVEPPAVPDVPDTKRPAKKAPKKANAAGKKVVVVEPEFPEFYEKYTKKNFEAVGFPELRWLATQWEVHVKAPVNKPKLVAALLKEAKNRLKTWPADER